MAGVGSAGAGASITTEHFPQFSAQCSPAGRLALLHTRPWRGGCYGSSMSDLVVIAAPQEAAHLPSDVAVVLTGIGMAQAAVAATRAILERRPTRVVNLGSVGSLDPMVHGIQRPSAVINRDLNADALRAAGLHPDERIELGGDGPVLGTGDSFVIGGPQRDALLARCQLVDMEGFAIAHACRVLGVELVMIKHVSDPATEASLAWKDLVDVSAWALAAAYAGIRLG